MRIRIPGRGGLNWTSVSEIGTVLALIPARAGSKGLPGKNVRPFRGRPLIAWSIEAALESGLATVVWVSTDGEEIASVARGAGAEVPWLRPAELATDTASSLDVALHALDAYGPVDWLLLLQPTSPLRTAEDIRAAARLVDEETDAVVSVCPAHPLTYFRRETNEGYLAPLTEDAAARRQDTQAPWLLNGAMYLVRTEVLRATRQFLPPRTRPYVMPALRSVDIDTEEDWEMATLLAAGATREML